MRAAWAQLSGLLLLVSALLGASPADGVLIEPSLLLGAVGALLLVWGVARPAVPPAPPAGPVSAARAHRRTPARGTAPRQSDPDAAGRTRSRAPAGALPAV